MVTRFHHGIVEDFNSFFSDKAYLSTKMYTPVPWFKVENMSFIYLREYQNLETGLYNHIVLIVSSKAFYLSSKCSYVLCNIVKDSTIFVKYFTVMSAATCFTALFLSQCC
jgi:hypothetical protein